MTDEISGIKLENIRLFLKDSKSLMESQEFGEIKGFEKEEKTKDGKDIFQLPYVEYTDCVCKFRDSFWENELFISDDITSQNRVEVLETLANPDINFSEYSVKELLTMLGIILQGDRICDGLLLDYLETGRIQKILSALQEKV